MSDGETLSACGARAALAVDVLPLGGGVVEALLALRPRFVDREGADPWKGREREWGPASLPAAAAAPPPPLPRAARPRPRRPAPRPLAAPDDPARLAAAAAAAAEAAGRAAPAAAAPALTCAACDAAPAAPVAAPCGHALCGGCWPCPRCPAPDAAAPDAGPRPAVLLRAIVNACWGRELRVQRLLAEGDAAAAAALARGLPDGYHNMSPLMLALQCHALYLLHRAEEALDLADLLKCIRPTWSRGYYWRGCLLLLGNRPQEAVSSLLMALALAAGAAPANPPSMPCPRTLLQIGLGQCESVTDMQIEYLINEIAKEVVRLRRHESKSKDCELLLAPCDLPPGLAEEDFECILCSRLLWKPVTTSCGHTFCAGCLDRCLDHSATCPLCMTPLHNLLMSPRCPSAALEAALRLLIPASALAARQLALRLDLAAPAHLPVFVCTVAWPGVPCPLYVFEPRYRLLVRRCVESGERHFGMAAGAEGERGFVDVGTVLDVRDWLRMADGCSLLTAVGARRFRVLGRGERDGYHTAKVELLKDRPPAPGVYEYAAAVRHKAELWVSSMPAAARAEVERAFGRMPDPEPPEEWGASADGPAWAWWLLAILPLSPRLQVAILATTTLEKRLRAIEKTLDSIR